MKLLVPTKTEIVTPPKTRIIRNDDFLTLARKEKGMIHVLTIPIEKIGVTDFLDENAWTDFSKWEIEKIIKI